jgi:hypothetical protein
LATAAEVEVRRERTRPFIPTAVLSGFSSPDGMIIQAGLFGLGPDSILNQWLGREDVSIQFMWQLESFGLGNPARIKSQRDQQSRAIIEPRNAQDTVAAEDHSERQHRGPGADQPIHGRLGHDRAAAGGGLRAPVPDDRSRRVLYDGRRVQPCAL